jgi:hypothetical protein
MPLYWTIDSRLQLVTAVADGDVSKGDVEAYLAIVNGSPNIPEWHKLFDARFGRLDFSAEDVNYLGAIIRAADIARTAGPLAFVTPESETPELGRLLCRGQEANADLQGNRACAKMAPEHYLQGLSWPLRP